MHHPSPSASLANRFTYDENKKRFYVNLENYSVETLRDIHKIEFLVAERLCDVNHRVAAVVNYENFAINPELLGDYASMVNRLMEHFYSGVTRYTTSSSLREELGNSLQQKNLRPNFYETDADAKRALDP